MRSFFSFKTILRVVVLWIIFMGASIQAQADPIKIGFVGDFSNVTKRYCLSAYQAARMAVDELNAEGGLLGRTVVLIKRDAGADPQKHYEFVRELARDENVAAILGGASSPCIVKASAAAREEQIPYLISVGNTQAVVVEQGHPFVFLFEANSWMETKGFSIFASLMPWRRYSWLGPNYSWGREVYGYFQQHFTEMGVPLDWVVQGWHPLGSNNDFHMITREIMDARPDALVIASWGEDMLRFIRQAKSEGLLDEMAVFGWFFFMSEDVDRLIPEGIWTLTRAPFNYLAEKYPQTKEFVKKFHEKYGVYPLGFTICCYDSMIAWRQAVLKAGAVDRVAVAKTLKGLPFDGLRGISYIRAVDGQMNCPTFFGRLVYSTEYGVAVMESVIEIPAAKTWLNEYEIHDRRKADHDS